MQKWLRHQRSADSLRLTRVRVAESSSNELFSFIYSESNAYVISSSSASANIAWAYIHVSLIWYYYVQNKAILAYY